MKLTKHINIVYTIFSLLTVVLGGFVFFFIFQSSIIKSAKETLLVEKQSILTNIKETNEVPKSNYIIDITPIYKDEVLKDHFKEELISKKEYATPRPVLHLVFSTEAQGGFYTITLQHSLVKTNSLIQSTITTLSIIFSFLVIGSVVFSSKFMKMTLRPFYNTLYQISNFDLTRNKSLRLKKSRIFEFNQLNDIILNLAKKINNDYQNLKEYNENISHEVQTPLAVVRNKIEALLNTGELDEQQLKLMSSAYSNCIELSKIIKGLTLISKIDNLEFEKQTINLSEYIEKLHSNFSDFFEIKNINFSSKVDKNYSINIHASLADVLLNNIFKNAVNHNVENGLFEIQQKGDEVYFMNSSSKTSNQDIQIKRFRTKSLDVSSTGIGLSIIKKICDTHNFDLQYYSKNKMHILVVKFKNS